jgi:hypothetical protein
MDPVVAAMIQLLGGADPSSATSDPVINLLLGQYQQPAMLSEEQLYETLAPTILQAGSEGPRSARAIAAARIRSGESPWTVTGDKELRGGIDEKEWKSFVNRLFNEQNKVRTAALKQELEPDYFEKQGLPGMDKAWNTADLYRVAPKAFAGALEGFDEALSRSQRNEAEIARLAAGRQVLGEKNVLEVLRREVEKEMSKTPKAEKKKRDTGILGKPTDWLVNKIAPLRKLDEGASKLREMIIGGGEGDIVKKKMNVDDEARRRLAELVAATPEGRPIAYRDKGADAAALQRLQQETWKRQFIPGTAENKMAQAERIAQQVGSQLESAGVTPLMDALLRSAALRSRMKNG